MTAGWMSRPLSQLDQERLRRALATDQPPTTRPPRVRPTTPEPVRW